MSEPARPTLVQKAYDGTKAVDGPATPEDTSVFTAEILVDSDGASDISVEPAAVVIGPSRYRTRHHAGFSQAISASIPQPGSFRADRVAASVALIAGALGGLFVEGCNAWNDQGLRGVFKAYVILVVSILDTIWDGLAGVLGRVGPELTQRVSLTVPGL
jgi:hypothetical protein